MQTRTLILILLLALASSGAHAADVTVTLQNFTFSPATVTINVGDTVTWTNVEGFHDLRANDNSFSSPAAGAPWTFSRTFNTAGTFGYFCTLHGGPTFGMRGTVVVQGGGGQDEAGTLRFSQGSYSVGEGAGSATVTVQRVGGDDGAVSVAYSATPDTAAAGSDFTAVSGTLSWANNDDNPKTFQVPILNDTVSESNETVDLTLSNPTGGAALDPALRNATLTIQDNDANPGGPVAAPTNLQAMVHGTTELMLTWTDNANNETGFRIERRTLTGSFQEVGSVAANVTSFIDPGLTPATQYIYRVRAAGTGTTFSPYSNEARAATNAVVAPCVEDADTLCVNNERFAIEVDWRTGNDDGFGSAVAVPTAPDSGLFHFFGAANIEMLIKVLNACPLNNRYWVFYAATTNVEFTVTVTDTQTGKVEVYFNPLNTPAPPIQDTDAFDTCP